MKFLVGIILPLSICALPVILFYWLVKLRFQNKHKIPILIIGLFSFLLGILTPLFSIGIYQFFEQYYSTERIVCSSGSSLFFMVGYGITFCIIPFTIVKYSDYKASFKKNNNPT